MGLVRRLIEELLSTPLDDIHLELFRRLLSQLPDEELLLLTLIAIGLMLVGTVMGLSMEMFRLLLRGGKFQSPRLILLILLGALVVDGLLDFWLAALHELRGRATP